MDQAKIGRFIADRRKMKKLTQMQLAEKMGVTDRAVSKWERGLSLPDSSLMLPLCRELGISAGELLCGEVLTMEDRNETLEKELLDMAKYKEKTDRHLLALEIVIGFLSMIVLLSFTFAASFFNMEAWLRILLILTGFLVCFVGLGFAIRIEQVAGYYVCKKCGHKYVPTFRSVLRAMHVNRTRFMQCPECGKWSWQKKVVKKD